MLCNKFHLCNFFGYWDIHKFCEWNVFFFPITAVTHSCYGHMMPEILPIENEILFCIKTLLAFRKKNIISYMFLFGGYRMSIAMSLSNQGIII